MYLDVESSQNFDNFKFCAIFLWETPFWYCSTIFRCNIGGIGDPLPILTSERQRDWEALFIPNHVANWPNKLQIGPPAVPYMYIYLFRPLIATCPNFFGMCSSHEIQNEPIFGMTFQNVSLSTFAMLSIFYCEKFKICKLLNSFFYSQFIQRPNFFGIGFVHTYSTLPCRQYSNNM